MDTTYFITLLACCCGERGGLNILLCLPFLNKWQRNYCEMHKGNIRIPESGALSNFLPSRFLCIRSATLQRSISCLWLGSIRTAAWFGNMCDAQGKCYVTLASSPCLQKGEMGAGRYEIACNILLKEERTPVNHLGETARVACRETGRGLNS